MQSGIADFHHGFTGLSCCSTSGKMRSKTARRRWLVTGCGGRAGEPRPQELEDSGLGCEEACSLVRVVYKVCRRMTRVGGCWALDIGRWRVETTPDEAEDRFDRRRRCGECRTFASRVRAATLPRGDRGSGSAATLLATPVTPRDRRCARCARSRGRRARTASDGARGDRVARGRYCRKDGSADCREHAAGARVLSVS